MIGHARDHYRTLEKIGAGGMGEVYRAHDERLGRDVTTTMIYTHLLNRGPAAVRSPLDRLLAATLSGEIGGDAFEPNKAGSGGHPVGRAVYNQSHTPRHRIQAKQNRLRPLQRLGY